MYNLLEPFSVCSAGLNTCETMFLWSGRGTLTPTGIKSASERGKLLTSDCRVICSLTTALNRLTDIVEKLFTKLNEMETARAEDTGRHMEKTELLVPDSTELKAQVADINAVGKMIAENTVRPTSSSAH